MFYGVFANLMMKTTLDVNPLQNRLRKSEDYGALLAIARFLLDHLVILLAGDFGDPVR